MRRLETSQDENIRKFTKILTKDRIQEGDAVRDNMTLQKKITI